MKEMIFRTSDDGIVMNSVSERELIRCKDCKYRNDELREECNHWLPCMEIRTEGDWFCADGERREDM